jgi:hypothetical protein
MRSFRAVVALFESQYSMLHHTQFLKYNTSSESWLRLEDPERKSGALNDHQLFRS